jgi:hypothetical protein
MLMRGVKLNSLTALNAGTTAPISYTRNTNKRSFMKNLIEEIQYQFEMLTRWMREQKLRLFGVSRAFYCQSDIEGNRKCTNQCEHCKEYYKPLEQ